MALNSGYSSWGVPTVTDESVREIKLAGLSLIVLRMKGFATIENIENSNGQTIVHHHFFFRSADVLQEATPSEVKAFFAAHEMVKGNIPQFVWFHDRAVTPIPLIEAVRFWSERMPSAWSRQVCREIERMEGIIVGAFEGAEDNAVWEFGYKGDGGLTFPGPVELTRPTERKPQSRSRPFL